ncbi:hypothetical protein TTHERM_001159889 (macronuclear) [Tetrahymena thermophila SB210]|uniref:Uncharacterized protein n=1 Tax=Tetrahymena thermophila (strain SB210) TaxID=312017 RepID=W7X347_TETTS|nr:hypothetical protein TTHERM_001159889 [Tetrahymena thermophila SB210]EWS73730.1 hypothetical protein TTHERM_001159889 [Tetrahymena thermophila SB210]|eukprot:XP_012653768.1 hypothetical protein TTHERM_001159889 [Tetrahymena thermophila SB210]
MIIMIIYQPKLVIYQIILVYQIKGKQSQMVICPIFCQIKQLKKTCTNMFQIIKIKDGCWLCKMNQIHRIKLAYFLFQEIIINKIFMRILQIFRLTLIKSKILVQTSLSQKINQYHLRFKILLKNPQVIQILYTHLIKQNQIINIIWHVSKKLINHGVKKIVVLLNLLKLVTCAYVVLNSLQQWLKMSKICLQKIKICRQPLENKVYQTFQILLTFISLQYFGY